MQHAAPGRVSGGDQGEGMHLLRWDWHVEMEPDDQLFCRGCDLAR